MAISNILPIDEKSKYFTKTKLWNNASMKIIRIGNGQGFWGDSIDAPVKLAKSNNIDYLTLDYLAEVTLSIILASITRGIIISLISVVIFSFWIEIQITNYLFFFIYLFLSSFIMGAAGFIAGMWADKFDHMATVTNFIIVPLSFLSGTFYSVERLPEVLKILSNYNPFFHMIDGFRYSFIGNLDGSLTFGILYLSIISVIMWLISYYLYKKGYKIKS